MALPNPSMSFSPFAILTAEEMNDLVENIEALADGSGLDDGAVIPSKLVAGTGTTWPWVTWSPTYANITVGNGTAVTRYKQTGKNVQGELNITAGTTTSFGNSITISPPVTPAARYGSQPFQVIGSAAAADAGVALVFGLIFISSSTTEMILRWISGSASTSTFPFTEGTGDSLAISFAYEAA